jgi:hypothetical protein
MRETEWGPWHYKSDTIELVYTDPQSHRDEYSIDIERQTSSAQLLDTIYQIADKTWAGPSTVGYLVLAFKELLHPQSTLCSGGMDKRLDDVRGHLEKYGFEVPPAE